MILTPWRERYVALDIYTGGWLPGGVTRSEASALREAVARDVLPDGPIEDYVVGWNRITTGTVGGSNPFTGEQWPTFGEAWRSTDQTFHGWLPGGVDPDVPDPVKDLGRTLITAAVIVGVAAVSR